MATHFRDKTTHCDRCHANCTITANLDKGTVVRAAMPDRCLSPRWCRDEFKKGIFDRQFGERIVEKLKL